MSPRVEDHRAMKIDRWINYPDRLRFMSDGRRIALRAFDLHGSHTVHGAITRGNRRPAHAADPAR